LGIWGKKTLPTLVSAAEGPSALADVAVVLGERRVRFLPYLQGAIEELSFF
jgi:hypothetical protein